LGKCRRSVFHCVIYVYVIDYPAQNPPKFPPGSDGVKEEETAKAELDAQMQKYLEKRQTYLTTPAPEKDKTKYV
jgi:hypothetical protein